MLAEIEEVGICYKEDLYTELVYINKDEKDSLLKIIMDETIELFKIADKEIKKSELDSLMFEGMTIQFYEEDELKRWSNRINLSKTILWLGCFFLINSISLYYIVDMYS